MRVSVDGVLVVHKPRGPTSHDLVATARRVFGTRAVGHAGTLDPMASGVLLLLVGEGTKLSPFLTLDDKEYRARVVFGRSTDTLDAEGRTVDERALPGGWLDPARLETAVADERARSSQEPPAFSAISIDGERAHRRVRRGEDVRLPPRPVEVKRLHVVEVDDGGATFDLVVSKGYYVRSFARDVGAQLGVPAHLAALERRASGPFRLEDAAPWPFHGCPRVLSLAEAVRRSLPAADLTAPGVARARQGQRLTAGDFAAAPEGRLAAWIAPEGGLVAVGRPDGDGGYRVVRGFRSAPASH
jgi:tRNA pseudouridine55 synthase